MKRERERRGKKTTRHLVAYRGWEITITIRIRIRRGLV
jgi:hypothetical protein